MRSSPEEAPSGAEVARSLLWTYGMALLGFSVQIGFAALIARILLPEDYGVVAAAAAIVRFLQYFADFGLMSAVIQKREFDTRTDAPTIFLLGLALNILLLTALWLVTGTVLTELLEPVTSLPLLMALAGIGVLTALGQTARGLLARRMDFRRIGLISVLSAAVGQGAVTLPLAWFGHGPWAIVVGLAAQALLGSLLAWSAAPHPVLPPSWDRGRLRDLGALGGWFSLLRILDSAGIHLLPAVVAALAGPGDAGRWDRAWVLAVVPIEMLATAIGRVTFPTFSRLSVDRARLKSTWFSVLLLSAALLSPIAVGMAIAAPDIAAVVLGADWEGTGGAMALLVLWALLRGLAQINGGLCEANGRFPLRALHQTGYLLVLASALVILRPRDAGEIAAILLAVDFGAQALLIVLTARVLDAPPLPAFGHVLLGMSLALPVGVGAALAMTAAQSAQGEPPLVLAVTTTACAVSLAAGIVLHPSRTLRTAIAERVFGQVLAVPEQGQSSLSRLCRYLAR